jgi:hypothetical protein
MMGLVGSVLRLLLARVALKEAASRAARLVVLFLLAGVLLAAAIAFGLYAIYAWLAMHFTPPQAAGICAGALLLLAAIVVAIATWRPRRKMSRPEAMLPPEAERVLEWGRANPLGAAAAALVVGFLAGRRLRG